MQVMRQTDRMHSVKRMEKNALASQHARQRGGGTVIPAILSTSDRNAMHKSYRSKGEPGMHYEKHVASWRLSCALTSSLKAQPAYRYAQCRNVEASAIALQHFLQHSVSVKVR